MTTLCDNCDGSCCRHLTFPPFGRGAGCEEPAWLALPQELRDEIEVLDDPDDPFVETGCSWLDVHGRCERYSRRPQACRDFEVGGEDCQWFRMPYGLPIRVAGSRSQPGRQEALTLPKNRKPFLSAQNEPQSDHAGLRGGKG